MCFHSLSVLAFMQAASRRVRSQAVVVSGLPVSWKAGDIFEASIPAHELVVFTHNNFHDLRYDELSLAAKAVLVRHPKQTSSLHALRERFCAHPNPANCTDGSITSAPRPQACVWQAPDV